MSEWRECAFAKSIGKTERICEVLSGMQLLPHPDRCASCPIPALVEAVRAAEQRLEQAERSELRDRFCVAEARRILITALSALEKEVEDE
jgi:hypothetical protein